MSNATQIVRRMRAPHVLIIKLSAFTALSGILVASLSSPAFAASSFTVTNLNATVTGTSVKATVTLKASSRTTVQQAGVCVRDSTGANKDFTLQSNVLIPTTGTTLTTPAKTFAPGTYTYYACIKVNNNNWSNPGSVKTFTVAAPTPTPTPTPTPDPTPTPPPVPDPIPTPIPLPTDPMNSGTSTNSLPGNIAFFPDFYDSTWLSWNDGYNKFPVTWQGYTNTLQIAPNPEFISGQRASGWTGENEVNGMVCSTGLATGCTRSQRGTHVAVRPGKKVTYSAYVWVTPSTVGAPNGGGFQFFMDVYGSAGRIKELQGTNGCDGCGRINVPFGSTGWTFVQMQFIVPSSYKADGALGATGGSRNTPTGIIPILQLNNWAVPSGYDEKATAYIRNTVLTIE